MTNSKIIFGDCVSVLQKAPSESVDLILTDPPYLVNFQDRSGRTLQGDKSSEWLYPAFREAFRVLKKDSFCISFYGLFQVEKFMLAFKKAGFRPVGHFVFEKRYASSKKFLAFHHESAFLLVKGNPTKPKTPMKDILPFKYTGNKLHPTQKAAQSIRPLIENFSKKGEIVLDPFCGSASTGVAAKECGRRFIGIEKDRKYFEIAERRILES